MIVGIIGTIYILSSLNIQFTSANVDIEINDVCDMIRECSKKYPDVGYAVTLESETLVQNYRSTVYVYLKRNHIILERKKYGGEWPDTNSEIIKIGRTKLSINDNYKEEIREGVEWFSQVYLGDKETHYENKEESDNFVNESIFIEWIDE